MSSLSKIIIILLGLSCFACSTKQNETVNQYELIRDIVKDSLQTTPNNKILVLTENGCLGCNKSFAYLIEGMLDSDALIIVTAVGTSVDISNFSENKSDNIIFDYKNYFQRNNILEKSGAIFLSNNKVDTIITIEAEGIEGQLKYIKRNVLN